MINKQITLSNLGGFPFDQQTLEFMQSSYNGIASAMVGFTGDNVIVSGVVRSGGKTSNGWIIYKGELLPFNAANSVTNNFTVRTLKEAVKFEDTQNKEVYITKYAENCGDTEGANFSTLTRLDSYKQFCANLETYKTTVNTKIDNNYTTLNNKIDSNNTTVNNKIDSNNTTINNKVDQLNTKTLGNIDNFKTHYSKNIITGYIDLFDFSERTSSISGSVTTPFGYSGSGEYFGRNGMIDNYLLIPIYNQYFPQGYFDMYTYSQGNNLPDGIYFYFWRGDRTGELATRFWYLLVRKNMTSPLSDIQLIL